MKFTIRNWNDRTKSHTHKFSVTMFCVCTSGRGGLGPCWSECRPEQSLFNRWSVVWPAHWLGGDPERDSNEACHERCEKSSPRACTQHARSIVRVGCDGGGKMRVELKLSAASCSRTGPNSPRSPDDHDIFRVQPACLALQTPFLSSPRRRWRQRRAARLRAAAERHCAVTARRHSRRRDPGGRSRAARPRRGPDAAAAEPASSVAPASDVLLGDADATADRRRRRARRGLRSSAPSAPRMSTRVTRPEAAARAGESRRQMIPSAPMVTSFPIILPQPTDDLTTSSPSHHHHP